MAIPAGFTAWWYVEQTGSPSPGPRLCWPVIRWFGLTRLRTLTSPMSVAQP